MREVAEADRPRERLLSSGAAALSDRELVAILLETGGVGLDAHELAERLLTSLGGVPQLARASPHDLLRQPGLGPAKAARIAAAFELANRASARNDHLVLGSSAVIAAAARPLLANRSRERVIALSCDVRLRLIGTDVISDGGPTSAGLSVRDVLAAVLRRDGVAFAVAHNHPSGDATPSDADVLITQRLHAAADSIGLRMLDHVVLAGSAWRSVTSNR